MDLFDTAVQVYGPTVHLTLWDISLIELDSIYSSLPLLRRKLVFAIAFQSICYVSVVYLDSIYSPLPLLKRKLVPSSIWKHLITPKASSSKSSCYWLCLWKKIIRSKAVFSHNNRWKVRDQNLRPEGGEWEPIKISSEIDPSAYIPKSSQTLKSSRWSLE